jgi:hypothetical protein
MYLPSHASFFSANLPQRFGNSCVKHDGSSIRVIISFACSVGSAGAGSRGQFHSTKSQSQPTIRRQRFPRVLPCVNRHSMFLFFSFSNAWAWRGWRMLKVTFPFYFKRPSVYDIYDIGTRLSMNTAMSPRSYIAGELLCSNAGTDAAWTSSTVPRCRDKIVVSAIARTDSK